MIYTVETPGVDALCGVFTSKRALLDTIIEYVENLVYILPKDYSKLVLDIKSLRDGGCIDVEVFTDADILQKEWYELVDLENGNYPSDAVHTLRIEQWEPNSSRYLTLPNKCDGDDYLDLFIKAHYGYKREEVENCEPQYKQALAWIKKTYGEFDIYDTPTTAGKR